MPHTLVALQFKTLNRDERPKNSKADLNLEIRAETRVGAPGGTFMTVIGATLNPRSWGVM